MTGSGYGSKSIIVHFTDLETCEYLKKKSLISLMPFPTDVSLY